MIDTAALVSLATSVPPHQFHQKRDPRNRAQCDGRALSGVRIAFQPVCQHRHPPPLRRQADRMVSRAARLARAHAGLSRRRRNAVHRRRAQGDGACRSLGRRCRHRRHGVFDRDRHADARGARRRQARLSPRRFARAGVRPRLRRRRVGPVDRRAAGAGAARQQRAAGRGRTLHPRRSARRTDQGQRRRRRLFGDGAAAVRAARRRRRRDAGSRRAANTWAGHARHHGLERRSAGFRRHLPPHHPALRRGEHRGPPSPACSTRMELVDRRRRPLRLPSRRHQGDRRAGARAVARSGLARPRARGASPTTATCRRRRCSSCSNARCAGPAAAVAADGARARASPQAASRCEHAA